MWASFMLAEKFSQQLYQITWENGEIITIYFQYVFR